MTERAVTVERFGRVDDTEVLQATLRTGAGAEARIITYGAILRDLVVPGPKGPQRVVLGLGALEHYVAHSPNFGAIVGRYGNRIGGARFTLDGRMHELVANEGASQLHGGPRGFAKRVWTLLDAESASATLALVSEDGDMGYPGRLVARCTYELLEPATLRIVLEASCDAATPVNLTTHSYYNLDGAPTILDHVLAIEADFFTPTRPDLIPTGEIRSVAGTPYDFRQARRIGSPEENGGIQYDINLVLRHTPGALGRAVSLVSEKSGVAMEVWTTEPGIQFYNGHLLPPPVPGLGGVPYQRFGGLCLEPQRFPDGPNQPHFPACILRPGGLSRQVSEMRFRAL
jgi:aldose 1-epimerase